MSVFTASGLQLGVFTTSYFGLIVLAGAAVGLLASAREARRRGQNSGELLRLAIWAGAGAMVLGRLFFVLNPPPSVALHYTPGWYLRHLLDLQAGPLAVWNGGLSRAGITCGAALGMLVALRRRGLDVPTWADILAPALIVALLVMPWANVANGQLLGPPTGLPWGMAIDHRVPPYTDLDLHPPSIRFHPTPAYLSLWTLLAAGTWAVVRRRFAALPAGGSFVLAAALLAPGMLALDFLRIDVARPVFGLTGMQWLALGVLAGAGLLAWRCHAAGQSSAHRASQSAPNP